MRRAAVVGAGLMGCGIAQLLAAKGVSVSLFEPFDEPRSRARHTIESICQSIDEPLSIVDRITFTNDLEEAASTADVVIEAIPEKPELKQDMFAQLVRYAQPDALLATNSSVIPVTTIATELSEADAQRLVGMHFWNPPYLVPLVEVVQGERTTLDTVNRAMTLLTHLGRSPVHIRKDVVVGNRLQHALWREAIALVADGVVDGPDVDVIVKNSFGLRLSVLGPMENADLVGLGLTQDVHNVVFPQLNNDLSANALLQEMLDRGDAGMASGQGFYQWPADLARRKHQQLNDHLVKVTRKS